MNNLSKFWGTTFPARFALGGEGFGVGGLLYIKVRLPPLILILVL